ncbi:hypothetical protein COB21_03420 [Candidatus Aerophobetes bacterium]|uniref:NYN domain-containing protein n=1 Tax=Aerophobetes bacterium TaxID=2030807 RepID=A0A2A4X3W4_UNCAE|nr:MAG: hypothetical protein COB21_03420 [Candidatus Aerophobetes bacterium]
MRYIVDGYNLFFTYQEVYPSVSFEDARALFIQTICSLASKSRLKITLVFDTHHVQEPDLLPHVKKLSGIDVIYAPSDLSCDDYIIEMLSGHKSHLNWTIVTSDNNLQRMAKQKNTLCLSTHSFIELIDKKICKNSLSLDTKNSNFTHRDQKRWEKIFEQKIDGKNVDQ